MKREELIAYDKWLTRRKWGTGEIISPEKAADLYLAEHPLPPAEGAEEILDKYPHSTEYPSFIHENSAIAAMHEFAALHAQRIAEKMVSERLREYHLNEGYDVVIVGNPDKEIPGDIFEDIKVAALELGELRGLKVMITGFTANYLKTRDSHD